MMKKKRNGGFTLIELIVVIAILGILAAIIIPRLGAFSEGAEKRAVQADHRIIVASAQMLYAETGEWPEDTTESNGVEDVLSDYFDEEFSDAGTHVITGGKIISTWKGASATPEDGERWTYEMEDDTTP